MNSGQKNLSKTDKKEILNNLLKQLIDQKLSRLEKRNITEIKTFQTLSGEVQDLILSLENMSQNVRKEICIQRQKYLNNQNKQSRSNSKTKKEASNRKKTPKSKLRRLDSKSYDPLHADVNSRSNKSQIIGTAKSKSKGKLNLKIDSKKSSNIYAARKTEGNINTNFNKTLIPHAKQKRANSPFVSSQEKLNKTMANKGRVTTNTNTTQKRTSAQKKKSVGKNSISKTERKTKVSASKFLNANKNVNTSKNKDNKNDKNNITVKNYGKNNINNISTLEKYDSNNMDDSRLNVLDVFRQSQKEDNKKTNITKENKNKDNKDNNKKESKCGLISALSKQFGKVGTIQMDEKLVNDSLLVTNSPEGEISINMDDLIPGTAVEEPTNPKANNNNNNKSDPNKKDTDINNTQNANTNTTDVKVSKRNSLHSSVVIYNKLKRTKITFLEGEKDFDLIFKDSKIEDMDLNVNLNENDEILNTTEISDQMSLEEKFESNLDIISGYLDIRDICNLMLVNKECFKTIINILVSKTEISIELLEEEIKKIKENNISINFDSVKKKPLKLNVNSMRAISLLNSSSGNNILALNVEQLNKKEIILIYSIYFVAIGKKKDIILLDDKKKLEYIQNYFKQNCVGKNNFGQFIEKELNGIVMDDSVISFLHRICNNHLSIISPNYFQRINKDIAILVFVIKDLLEQLGILESKYLKPDKEYILLNARLQNNKAILKELNLIEENIY